MEAICSFQIPARSGAALLFSCMVAFLRCSENIANPVHWCNPIWSNPTYMSSIISQTAALHWTLDGPKGSRFSFPSLSGGTN
eukprot:9277630-Ditylum_brightwellii.AAC.1